MSNLAISLSTFNFDNSPVRTTEINNQLWFLANDICSILEYKNPRRAIELHCKEKGVTKRYTLTNGGEQEMIYISEPNLFRLIIKSKQEKAVIFEEWVMEDLLPTIRKTGSYSLTINEEQQYLISKAVDERVHRTGEKHQAIYHKFYDQFKITSYKNLPSNKFNDAIKFLGGINTQSKLSDDDLYKLARLVFVANYMREKIQLIEPALKLIDSSYKASFYSMGIEFRREIESARLIVMRETNHITTNHFSSNWNRILPEIRSNDNLLTF